MAKRWDFWDTYVIHATNLNQWLKKKEKIFYIDKDLGLHSQLAFNILVVRRLVYV